MAAASAQKKHQQKVKITVNLLILTTAITLIYTSSTTMFKLLVLVSI